MKEKTIKYEDLVKKDEPSIVYVIQEIPGKQEGRPKINIMGASDYSTSRDFIFLLPELSQIIFSPGPLIFKLRKGLKDFTTKLTTEHTTIKCVHFTKKDVERHPAVVDVLNVYGE